MKAELYIGLMSGTSADGIDAAVVEINDAGLQLKDHFFLAFDSAIKSSIESLFCANADEINRLAKLDIILAKLYAECVSKLLEKTRLRPTDIRAIGSHGQTIRHQPPPSEHPFSLQIGDPNTLAELSGIDVVCDFRRRDIAAGGQGAPLAPCFHNFVFSDANEVRAVINIGGIANISILKPNSPLLGFDSGPGNGLMDAWINKHHCRHYDNNGEWARSGKVNHEFVNTLLADPYFSKGFPKSTGKEYFNLNWLEDYLDKNAQDLENEDIQASLCALTAQSIANEVLKFKLNRVYICGGGVHNSFFVELLAASLPGVVIESTSSLGIDPDWVEAACFAWLAYQRLNTINMQQASVTGAHGSRILGGLYCA
ncbi:MAG: anhydro-N-acetylmuramic acid kinase [Flavobacteriales bacterium]|jgi:anhydro-N-acetylmuramic acid kinase